VKKIFLRLVDGGLVDLDHVAALRRGIGGAGTLAAQVQVNLVGGGYVFLRDTDIAVVEAKLRDVIVVVE
jgi:hypothetical protein